MFLKEVYGSMQVSLNYCLEQLFSMRLGIVFFLLSVLPPTPNKYLGWLEKNTFLKKICLLMLCDYVSLCAPHVCSGLQRAKGSVHLLELE